jgi:hypothetical protein
MVMVLYDVAYFYDITVIIIMLMHDIILVDYIMPVLDDMLMLKNLLIRRAGKTFFVHRPAASWTAPVKPVTTTHSITTHLFVSFHLCGA